MFDSGKTARAALNPARAENPDCSPKLRGLAPASSELEMMRFLDRCEALYVYFVFHASYQLQLTLLIVQHSPKPTNTIQPL